MFVIFFEKKFAPCIYDITRRLVISYNQLQLLIHNTKKDIRVRVLRIKNKNFKFRGVIGGGFWGVGCVDALVVVP